MPYITYVRKRFSPDSSVLIERAEAICAEYDAQGYTLTLRQLYYQFVSRGLIPNSEASYKRLGSVVNDARLAGLLNWSYIEDRTRNLRSLAHWDNPADVILAAAQSYRTDKWAGQPYRLEVWVEKDALIGVLEVVCERNDVPYFSCRGYTSQSEAWAASQRLGRYRNDGQEPVILYLGDHDPSGIDMGRDIQARMELFIGGVGFERLALNRDQVRQYDPPPNPAKITDSRYRAYSIEHGGQSWELDALEPTVLDALIQAAIERYRDGSLWEEDNEREEEEREGLRVAARRWVEVEVYLHTETDMQDDDSNLP